MTSHVEYALHGHVAEVVFSNPPTNYADVALLRGIGDAYARVDADPAARVILLRSQGRAFCAGADLARSDGIGGSTADPLREFYDQAIRIFAGDTPVVAAIQGAAVGAGLGLAVSADFRVASTEAKFVGNFTKLGFHPGFALTHTLPRLIGAQRAHMMFMTARRWRADEVLGWGLADMLAEPDELLAAARALAGEIAANAPLAITATRRTARAGLVQAVRETLVHEHAEQAKLRQTEDYAEGVAAVFERREPRFTGH